MTSTKQPNYVVGIDNGSENVVITYKKNCISTINETPTIIKDDHNNQIIPQYITFYDEETWDIGKQAKSNIGTQLVSCTVYHNNWFLMHSYLDISISDIEHLNSIYTFDIEYKSNILKYKLSLTNGNTMYITPFDIFVIYLGYWWSLIDKTIGTDNVSCITINNSAYCNGHYESIINEMISKAGIMHAYSIIIKHYLRICVKLITNIK